MTAAERMKNRLSKIGLYDIKENGNIDCELKAYAEGIDFLIEETENLYREAFAVTAIGEGIVRLEKMWGAERTELPAKKRREMIIKRMSYGSNGVTPQAIQEILGFLGADGEIEEYPLECRIKVKLKDDKHTVGLKNFIKNQVKELFPAQMMAEVTFE